MHVSWLYLLKSKCVNSDLSVSLTTPICGVEQLVLDYGGFSVGVFSHSKAVVLIVMMERAALM